MSESWKEKTYQLISFFYLTIVMILYYLLQPIYKKIDSLLIEINVFV